MKSVSTKRKSVENEVPARQVPVSSQIPRYEMIPPVAIRALADRFEYGNEIRGGEVWNAGSEDQTVLLNVEWLRTRLAHGIDHALRMMEFLNTATTESKQSVIINASTYQRLAEMQEDAAALMFAGALMVCAADAFKKDSLSDVE